MRNWNKYAYLNVIQEISETSWDFQISEITFRGEFGVILRGKMVLKVDAVCVLFLVRDIPTDGLVLS